MPQNISLSHYRPNVKVIVRFKIANTALTQMCVFNTKLIADGNKMAIFLHTSTHPYSVNVLFLNEDH